MMGLRPLILMEVKMPHPMNTFLSDFEYASDRSKRNSGGLYNTDTLIEQGDYPVDVRALEARAEMDRKIRKEYSDDMSRAGFVEAKFCDGDMEEGVSMCRPMYNDIIKKNSDY